MKQKAQNLINNSKAIIFDLDGVIINSTPFWRESKLLFLAKRGITDMNKIDAIGRLIGMGGKEVMQIYQKHFGLKGSLEDLFIEWSNISYELFMAAKEDLLDGALDFITHIDI